MWNYKSNIYLELDNAWIFVASTNTIFINFSIQCKYFWRVLWWFASVYIFPYPLPPSMAKKIHSQSIYHIPNLKHMTVLRGLPKHLCIFRKILRLCIWNKNWKVWKQYWRSRMRNYTSKITNYWRWKNWWVLHWSAGLQNLIFVLIMQKDLNHWSMKLGTGTKMFSTMGQIHIN